MLSFKLVILTQLLVFGSTFEVQPDWFTLRNNIDTSFSCEGRSYGYYADVANECQLYHVCNPQTQDGITTYRQSPFICPQTTVFDQQLLTCVQSTPSFICNGPSQASYVAPVRSFDSEVSNENLDSSVNANSQINQDTQVPQQQQQQQEVPVKQQPIKQVQQQQQEEIPSKQPTKQVQQQQEVPVKQQPVKQVQQQQQQEVPVKQQPTKQVQQQQEVPVKQQPIKQVQQQQQEVPVKQQPVKQVQQQQQEEVPSKQPTKQVQQHDVPVKGPSKSPSKSTKVHQFRRYPIRYGARYN